MTREPVAKAGASAKAPGGSPDGFAAPEGREGELLSRAGERRQEMGRDAGTSAVAY